MFTGFTLSQVGMVRHHQRVREPGWQRGRLINGVGAAASGTVLVVIVVSKFTTGAWIPVLVIPVLVLAFRRVHRHYLAVKRALHVPPATTHARGHTSWSSRSRACTAGCWTRSPTPSSSGRTPRRW